MENMEKKKSVGVQFLCKNKRGELVAILQVRAGWNAEKNTPESYPGACQVTAHGKLELGEDFTQALLREVKEELGEEAYANIKKIPETGKLTELVHENKPEKEIITYGVIIDDDTLKKLISRQKNKSFGGFKIIRASDISKIVDIKTINKEVGVTDETTIAMFPDDKEAVRIAFEKLG